MSGFLHFKIVKHVGSHNESGRGHSNKNCAGQASSWIRTLYYGKFWCDMTACREHNMPPAVLARECPMSDKLNAMFSNPWYFVVEDVSCTYALISCVYLGYFGFTCVIHLNSEPI